MNIYQFMSGHPWLTFFLAAITLSFLNAVILAPFRTLRRYMRHMDIAKNGWPPPHCDADGDFKKEERE